MLAPVIIFVYNRPEHTIKTIEALSENELARESDVFIFSDAAKNEASFEKVKAVRDYIDTIEEKKYFKSLTIKKAQENKGLAKSVMNGVSEIINKYGKVIVLEDDLITTPDFLAYMNEGLNYYDALEKVWSISGYNIPIRFPKSYKSDIYYSYRGCSWGWATWKNRWDQVDWDVKDYIEFKKNRRLRNQFNRGGRDMSNMLDAQMEGKIDSWAIRWCYTQSKKNMFTVYPVKSRVRNIGLDGSGTHSGITSHYNVEIDQSLRKCIFNNPELNQEILRNFQNHYGSRLNYYLIKPKSYIKKLLRM
ncbi:MULTISPECIES: glycosyltransferase [Bacillus cereus group]|uniref:glycosyltransferase n=1 Tax=Bacillus cereus group TaxID=86661 RepID=UPI000A362BE1|nr:MULTISPECIES: glycosyltransferase [Bacillus cereus group]MBG9750878.1 sugar transferase [Bacillus thuringiensis]MBG9779864.1 sugar transferase [Bacillus thuringiensis]MBG9925888.1 sugar transferase [Bacillus thuringiensis]MCU4721057.1 glycosyltransferase [Bacillus cereus]MDA2434731.1 glycosyltransferase [Bacillus cereus]